MENKERYYSALVENDSQLNEIDLVHTLPKLRRYVAVLVLLDLINFILLSSFYSGHGLIERSAHGIYIKPKKDPLLGAIYPNLEEIAKEIAKFARVDQLICQIVLLRTLLKPYSHTVRTLFAHPTGIYRVFTGDLPYATR